MRLSTVSAIVEDHRTISDSVGLRKCAGQWFPESRTDSDVCELGSTVGAKMPVTVILLTTDHRLNTPLGDS
jgi:hypothetical protein